MYCLFFHINLNRFGCVTESKTLQRITIWLAWFILCRNKKVFFVLIHNNGDALECMEFNIHWDFRCDINHCIKTISTSFHFNSNILVKINYFKYIRNIIWVFNEQLLKIHFQTIPVLMLKSFNFPLPVNITTEIIPY